MEVPLWSFQGWEFIRPDKREIEIQVPIQTTNLRLPT
jgi:hypothetical protein